MPVIEIDTPHGLARAHVHISPDSAGALVLGHGAGGGVEAPDLVAASNAALSERFTVVLVEQPYRVAVGAHRHRRLISTLHGSRSSRASAPRCSKTCR